MLVGTLKTTNVVRAFFVVLPCVETLGEWGVVSRGQVPT